MKENKLYKAIGLIEEDFIMEAKDAKREVKRLHLRRIVVIATAATLMLSVGAWAASSLIKSRVSHSSSISEYTNLPTPKEMRGIVGAEISLPENFSNGYRFVSGNNVGNENLGEDGVAVEQFNSFTSDYRLNDDVLIVSVDPLTIGNEELFGELVDKHKESELYYSKYRSKIVPPDYKLTEEDKADEASGKYVFAYGGDGKIVVDEVQNLTWKDDGVVYTFTTINSKLKESELVKMAKEMIDIK